MKQRLLTPGPTPVPEDTLLELARPLFYHRSAVFRQLLREVTEDLQYVFQTTQSVLTLTCSGTGGMEAALASALFPGAKVICSIAGRWGERWRGIARTLGAEVIGITVPPGEVVPPDRLAQALAEHPDATMVCATLSETATGVKNDIEAYGKLVGRTSALFVVDTISALGCVECRTDEWQIDINVTGSQKALMVPPGLAFVSVSDKAWRVIDANTGSRAFYFDLKRYREGMKTGDPPFTPALSLVRALRVSLKRIRAEGIENAWKRYALLASAARSGMLALRLQLLPVVPADGLTVAWVPEGIDGIELLARVENRFGIKLAGGQDALKGKIVRLGHMGHIDAFDILAAMSALEMALLSLGHALEPGAGVAAAQRVLSDALAGRS